MEIEQSKKCTKCGEIKLLSEYYNDKRVKRDGKQARCKQCVNKQKQEYRKANPEKRREYEAKKREDPEFRKKAAERNKKYYDKMVEENGQRLVRYRERSKDGYDKFRERNPQKMLYYGAKERAFKFNLPLTIVADDIYIPTHCPILGIPLTFNHGIAKDNSYTLDRIIPELGYVKGNVKVISRLANTMKQNASYEMLKLFSENILNYMNNKEIVQTIENNESIEVEDKELQR